MTVQKALKEEEKDKNKPIAVTSPISMRSCREPTQAESFAKEFEKA